MATEAPGLFVSFEGIDGSGKSTQARLLTERLRASGREVVLTREPGGSPGAEEIRRLVLTGDRGRWSPETEILLFTASRRDHLERTIRPALARGAVVITDRFADSTRLYQGATRGDLRSLVDRLHDLMIGVEPDVTVVIDMEPRKALSRSLRRLASAAMGAAQAVIRDEVREIMRSATEESVVHEPSTGLTDIAEAKAAQINATAAEAVTPDLPEDRFEAFGLPFQQRVRQGFLDLAREAPARFVVIDGDRPEAEVAQDVAAATLARLDPA